MYRWNRSCRYLVWWTLTEWRHAFCIHLRLKGWFIDNKISEALTIQNSILYYIPGWGVQTKHTNPNKFTPEKYRCWQHADIPKNGWLLSPISFLYNEKVKIKIDKLWTLGLWQPKASSLIVKQLYQSMNWNAYF